MQYCIPSSGIGWPVRERRRFAGRHDVRGVLDRTWRSFLHDDSGRRGRVVVNVADKTKSALVQRAYEALVAAAVAERAPCRADAGAQRRLRDDAALPNHVDQLVLADDPIAVANQVNEQIEHLRLEVNDGAGAPQLVARDVDLEIGEAEIQGGPLMAKAESWSPPSDDLSNSRRLWEWLHYTVAPSLATGFGLMASWQILEPLA